MVGVDSFIEGKRVNVKAPARPPDPCAPEPVAGVSRVLVASVGEDIRQSRKMHSDTLYRMSKVWHYEFSFEVCYEILRGTLTDPYSIFVRFE